MSASTSTPASTDNGFVDLSVGDFAAMMEEEPNPADAFVPVISDETSPEATDETTETPKQRPNRRRKSGKKKGSKSNDRPQGKSGDKRNRKPAPDYPKGYVENLIWSDVTNLTRVFGTEELLAADNVTARERLALMLATNLAERTAALAHFMHARKLVREARAAKESVPTVDPTAFLREYWTATPLSTNPQALLDATRRLNTADGQPQMKEIPSDTLLLSPDRVDAIRSELLALPVERVLAQRDIETIQQWDASNPGSAREVNTVVLLMRTAVLRGKS
jgi:hypothetical protein